MSLARMLWSVLYFEHENMIIIICFGYHFNFEYVHTLKVYIGGYQFRIAKWSNVWSLVLLCAWLDSIKTAGDRGFCVEYNSLERRLYRLQYSKLTDIFNSPGE